MIKDVFLFREVLSLCKFTMLKVSWDYLLFKSYTTGCNLKFRGTQKNNYKG